MLGEMTFRFASAADRLAIKRLWCEDFEHHEPYFSWYFTYVYRPERTLCGFVDDELAAVVQLAPYRLQLRGADLPACFLVGVITNPDFRGFGYGRKIVEAALDYLREQGYAAVLLATHIYKFYEKMGFANCYEQQRLLIPAAPATLPAGKWRKGRICSEDIAACQKIQLRQMQGQHGYVLRSEADWRQMFAEDACENGTLWLSDDAYVVLTPYLGELYARELCYADAPALADALQLCAAEAKRQKQDVCIWRAPLDAPLPQLFLIEDEFNYQMARACDLPQLLTAIMYPPQLTAELTLLVDGERLPLQIQDGKAELGGSGAEYALSTLQLTRLIWGVEQGREELPELLLQLFPACRTWINNYT